MGDLKEEIITKTMGIKQKPQETIDDVKKEAEHMTVIDKTMETAKKLAGTSELSEQLRSERERGERLEKEKDKAKEQAHAAEILTVRTELGAKIDGLAESLRSGASPKSIADQITEIKKAANELGMGGSKVSEIKEIMGLVESFNPKKNLVDQVRDAKELIATLQPAENKGKGATIEGVPAEIALQIKQIDANLQITLEKMIDERQRRDQDFKLTLLKFEEDRDIRRLEVDGKILVERERNELIAGALKKIGGAIGQGLREGAKSQPGDINQGRQTTGKIFQFEVPEGGFGTTECPNCHAPIAVGPTTTLAECVKCNTQYPVIRTPAAESPKAPEPIPD